MRKLCYSNIGHSSDGFFWQGKTDDGIDVCDTISLGECGIGAGTWLFTIGLAMNSPPTTLVGSSVLGLSILLDRLDKANLCDLIKYNAKSHQRLSEIREIKSHFRNLCVASAVHLAVGGLTGHLAHNSEHFLNDFSLAKLKNKIENVIFHDPKMDKEKRDSLTITFNQALFKAKQEAKTDNKSKQSERA